MHFVPLFFLPLIEYFQIQRPKKSWPWISGDHLLKELGPDSFGKLECMNKEGVDHKHLVRSRDLNPLAVEPQKLADLCYDSLVIAIYFIPKFLPQRHLFYKMRYHLPSHTVGIFIAPPQLLTQLF